MNDQLQSQIDKGNKNYILGDLRFKKIVKHYKVARNIISPDTTQVRAHKLRENYPWPGLSPYNPKLPYSVIHVPMCEVNHFLGTVIKRYIRSLKKFSLDYLKMYDEEIECEYVKDEEFNKIFEASYYSRFLRPLELKDQINFFENVLDFDYLKVDNSYFSNIEKLEGHYLESTIALFKKEQGKIEIEAIRHNGINHTKKSKSWGFLKMLVLQACSNRVLISDHPRCHFPIDSFIGVSNCLLDHNSIVYKLLKPHFYMQLPLNFAVLYISKSVALNNQDEIYTTLATTKKGFIDSFLVGFRGTKNSNTYSEYQFRMEPQEIYGPYGDFLEAYWWVVYDFVSNIINNIDLNYDDLEDWAQQLNIMIPGFPDAIEIRESDNLIRVLTSFIHNVSVEHSADHFSYASYEPKEIPLRLRKNMKHVEKHFFIKGEDFVRQQLANEMFFKVHTIKKLIDVQYEFPDALINYTKEFKKALKMTETKVPKGFIPVDQIACSIQF